MFNVKLKTILVVCLFISAVISRFFILEGSNYDGSNSTFITYIGYLVEDFALLLASLVYLFYFLDLCSVNKMAVFWLVFYFFAILLSPISANGITSLHLALRGVGYVLLGLLGCEYVLCLTDIYKSLKSVMCFIFFVMALSVLIESAMMTSFEHVYMTGAGGSFNGLLGLLTVYLIVTDLWSKRKNILILSSWGNISFQSAMILLILFLVYKMNSLSSILCFIISLVILWLLRGKFVKVGFVILILSVGTVIFYQDFRDGDFKIARKDFDTIKSGTGRFDTWEYCWDEITIGSNFKIQGHGFMADYDLLSTDPTLGLAHTCHNSFLTATVGLGYLGSLYYFAFVAFNLFVILTTNGESRIKNFVVISIVSMLIFGCASPVFPGMPTVLVSFSILLYRIRNFRRVIPNIRYG